MARILVIDDDASLAAMLFAALTGMGHSVTTSPDGKEGLAKQARDPADLVLTDIFMPEMDGLGAIRELRRLQPDLKIIAMSGGGRLTSKDYLPTATQFGALRILHKPFSIDALCDVVSDVLGG